MCKGHTYASWARLGTHPHAMRKEWLVARTNSKGYKGAERVSNDDQVGNAGTPQVQDQDRRQTCNTSDTMAIITVPRGRVTC